MRDNFILLGKMSGAFMALITICMFFGEPFLEDYVQQRINIHQESINKNKKESFRKLVAKKMEVEPDESHIRIGEMYKDVKAIKKEIKFYHSTTLLDK